MATLQERLNRMKAAGAVQNAVLGGGTAQAATPPSSAVSERATLTERLNRMKADGQAAQAAVKAPIMLPTEKKTTPTLPPMVNPAWKGPSPQLLPTPKLLPSALDAVKSSTLPTPRSAEEIKQDIREAEKKAAALNQDVLRDAEMRGEYGGESYRQWKETDQKLGKLREELKKAQPSMIERARDTVSGGLKGTGADMVNMLGTLRELGQESRDKQNETVVEDYARQLEEAQRALEAALEDEKTNPGTWTQGDIQSFYNARDDAQRKYDAVAKVYSPEVQQGTIRGTYEVADKVQQSSAQDIERAKKGLGAFGGMLVDAGASAAQMAGDAVGGALTGNGMIPFAMRAFGGGTQQARQDGADLKGSVAYGVASAAKEVFTEKMFNIALPFSKLYGGGGMDDAVERVIRKAVDKLASTDKGKKALGGLLTMAASGVSEGLEELIGDWMEWQMPRIYGGDVDTAQETLVNSLYDFAVGGLTGLAGGAFSAGQYDIGKQNRVQMLPTPEKAAPKLTLGNAQDVAAQVAEIAGTAQGAEDVQAQKTAPTEGTEYRATKPQNVELPTVPLIDLSTKDIPGVKGVLPQTGEALRKNAISRARKRLGLDQGTAAYIPVSNVQRDGNEYVLKITKASLNKMLNPAGEKSLSVESIVVMDNLERIANNGVYFKSEGDRDARPQIPGWDHLMTTVYIDGEPYSVDMRVKLVEEKPGSGPDNVLYYYSPEEILTIEKVGPGAPVERHALNVKVESEPTSDSIIPSPGDGVKTEYAQSSGRGSILTDEDWDSLMRQEPIETETEKSKTPIDRAKQALDAFYSGQMTDAEMEAAGMVRTDMPEAQKRSIRETVEREWGSFRRKMVDVGDTVAKMGREIKDTSLYSYYNLARASSNIAGSWLTRGGAQTDVMGRKVGQSLADLWEPIREKGSGYYKDFQEYLFHKHNIDRMSMDNTLAVAQAEEALAVFTEGAPGYAAMPESKLARLAAQGDEVAKARMELLNDFNRAEKKHNKPVFGFEVTADDSQAAVIRLEQAYPEFRELAEQVYQYNHNLMQYRVESGLLTQEQADSIEAIYPHYVPTYRVQEQEGKARKKREGQQVGKTIGRAEGGVSDLQPLHRAMAEQTYKVIREGAKNRFGVRLLNDALGEETRHGAKKYVYKVTDALDSISEDTFDLLDDPTPKLENTFTVYRDGKAYQMTVDKGLYEGIAALSPEPKERSIGFRAVRAANDLFKSLVTGYNPMFTAKNFARDLQEAGLYSKDLGAWMKNYPQAIKEIAENGEWWQRYQALGGVYSSVFDYQQGYRLDGKEHGKIRRVVDRVEAMNMAVEQAPRLAEFMAQAQKNGAEDMDALMDAMLAAADVTTNFGRSGAWGQTINQTAVPFFNPAVQGIDKMARTFLRKKEGKDWLKLIARCVALGVAPAIVNELLNKDEEGWEDIRDSDKDVNWLIHIGGGKYFRIPKGRDISVIQMFADRIGDAARGEEVGVGDVLKTAANQIAPPNPLENNILAAWMDADLLDKDSPGKTWYGADIESQRLQGYAPGQRYDENTDRFSKWLGGVLNLSPKKIHYLLDQYSGVVGDFVLPMLTPAGDKNFFLAPFKKAFVLDSVSSNEISGKFYDTGDQITYAKNGGDGAMAVVNRYWSKQSKAVSDIYAHIREIESSDLPNAEKLEQVRQAKAILNGIQKNAMEGLPAFEAAARKHYTSDDPDALSEAYREANREVFGAEYAIQLYDEKVYEKATEVHQDGGVSYDDFYNAYFAQKGIVGDKNPKTGKAIPLSEAKKKKLAVDRELRGKTKKQREAVYKALGISEKVWDLPIPWARN